MKIFAQVDSENNILSIINANDASDAQSLLIPGYPENLIDVTGSIKCENFLEVGRVYIQEENAILPAKVFPSWVMSEDKKSWIAPAAKPGDDYVWDEASVSWQTN